MLTYRPAYTEYQWIHVTSFLENVHNIVHVSVKHNHNFPIKSANVVNRPPVCGYTTAWTQPPHAIHETHSWTTSTAKQPSSAESCITRRHSSKPVKHKFQKRHSCACNCFECPNRDDSLLLIDSSGDENTPTLLFSIIHANKCYLEMLPSK